MDYMITKDDFYYIEIIMYDSIIGERLIVKEIPKEERYRIAIFVNNKLIDIKTETEILFLNTDDGYIVGPIYKDKYYVLSMNPVKNVSDDLLIYAANLYERFEQKQELIKTRKLIEFPGKQIY